MSEIKHELNILMKPTDAARILAISKRTLWSLTQKGEISCVRIGRAVRYDMQDLRKWIDQKREGENHE